MKQSITTVPQSLSFDDFRWTSRHDLCERLVRHIRSTPRDPTSHDSLGTYQRDPGLVAAEVLYLVVDGSCSPIVRDLVLDPEEDTYIRYILLKALHRPQGALSPADITVLLAEQRRAGGGSVRAWHLDDLLPLCRCDGTQELIWGEVTRLPPNERCQILRQTLQPEWHGLLGGRGPYPIAPELQDRLYDRWWTHDCTLLERGDSEDRRLNTDIALWSAERPQSRTFLRKVWPHAEGARYQAMLPWLRLPRNAEVLAELLNERPLSLADLPDLLTTHWIGRWDDERAADRLRTVLTGHFGEEELLLFIEDQVRHASRAWSTPDSGWDEREIPWAIWLLQHWPSASVDQQLASMLGCPDLHREVRRFLQDIFCERLWLFARDRAAETFSEWLGQIDAETAATLRPELIEDAVRRAGSEPIQSDRNLLLWSCEQDDPGFIFWGIQGLEQLGEDGPDWWQHLEEWAGCDDSSVALLASGALLKRGDAHWLERVVRSACVQSVGQRDPHSDHERGLALRVLGEIDPAAHVSLFSSAIMEAKEPDANDSPDQEAAFALARLGTPEALTLLVQSYFVGSEYLRRVLRVYLPVTIARFEGCDTPLTNVIELWRYARFPP